ncbi:hypothetical protein [Stenotrophomonas phage BUCTxx99]|nr:hypothetical protein [Stenotrophomonas phage BUCTxx99]
MSRIRLLAPTMTHTPETSTVDHDFNQKNLAKTISSLLIAGFQESAIADENLDAVVEELLGVGQALGDKLNLPPRLPSSNSGAVRQALGLLYIAQLAQGQAFGMLSSDPVAALAMASTWNQLHVDLTVDEMLEDHEAARFHELVGPNEDGDYPEMVAADQVGNYNRTGCTCGKDHGSVNADRPIGELSNEELLGTIPDELRPVLGLLSASTGKTEVEITAALRESFLRGERPGAAMERLLRESMQANHAPSPNAVTTEHEIDAGEDVVEQLFQQALASLPPLRADQRESLRNQLEAQRAEIETTAKQGGVQALNIKLPK